ncbi:MAG TPA: hypothetical protein VF126_05730, partial [Acidobacteriaceae bacterium]
MSSLHLYCYFANARHFRRLFALPGCDPLRCKHVAQGTTDRGRWGASWMSAYAARLRDELSHRALTWASTNGLLH